MAYTQWEFDPVTRDYKRDAQGNLIPVGGGAPVNRNEFTGAPAGPATAPQGNLGAVFGGGGSGVPAPQPMQVQPAGPAPAAAGQNPWLQQMGGVLSDQLAQQYQRNVLPGIASGALASGGYGGSRQGVLEANAANDLGKNTGAALTNLYGQGYTQGLQYDLGLRNNALGNKQADQGYDLGLRNNALGNTQASNSYDLGLRNNATSYDLGLRNNDLQYAGLDAQINQNNLGWQGAGAQLGLGLNGALQTGNSIGQAAGGAIQNTPLNYWQNFMGQANSVGQGFASQNQSGGGGSAIAGALGGAQLGNSLYNMWNKGSQGGAASGAGSYGAGTGAAFGNQDFGNFF